jgi:hypothetical protein
MITTPKSKKGKEKCRPSPQRLVFHVASVGLALQPRAPAVRRITPLAVSQPDCCHCR